MPRKWRNCEDCKRLWSASTGVDEVTGLMLCGQCKASRRHARKVAEFTRPLDTTAGELELVENDEAPPLILDEAPVIDLRGLRSEIDAARASLALTDIQYRSLVQMMEARS